MLGFLTSLGQTLHHLTSHRRNGHVENADFDFRSGGGGGCFGGRTQTGIAVKWETCEFGLDVAHHHAARNKGDESSDTDFPDDQDEDRLIDMVDLGSDHKEVMKYLSRVQTVGEEVDVENMDNAMYGSPLLLTVLLIALL